MRVDLAGAWRLRDETGMHDCVLNLPGDALTALQSAGLLPDPYAGRNEEACRWPAGRDWTARRSFELADVDAELVVSGLDTVAEIYVNDVLVLKAANSFRRFRADLSKAARVGVNEIAILFRSNLKAAEALQAAQPFYVPYIKQNCPLPHGNMLRKVQCDFGWDWNPALAPFGLYGDVFIEKKRIARLEGVVIRQHHSPGLAALEIEAHAAGAAEGEAVRFELCGVAAEGVVSKGKARARLEISNPLLWNPNGSGAQTLHELTLAMGEETLRQRIGLRSIELITAPDAAGARFVFKVNGREVFMRGANWIPADALPGRITPEKTRDLLQSAAAAHMNMIRVWGGGRYETDDFYEACDELGLLVWQDFMFSCSLYPSAPEFLAEVEIEAREQVLRLDAHACLALWCGDNELIGALSWYEESRKNRDRYLVAYDRLNRTLEQALTETAPGALWWPSSPSSGRLDFGDAWHDDRSGDMHMWSVWHEGKDFDHYRTVKPRFCSEFGFQSYPSLDVIRQFAAPEDFNIAAPVMEAHQKNAGGNARIAETMFRYTRFPVDFGNFVYVSQLQQALAIRTAVESWRALKPHCMGALYWQLNDAWPCASWSSLDYGGGWKLLHHLARRFYAPLFAMLIPQEGGYAVTAVNDGPEAAEMMLEVQALNMNGDLRPLAQFEGRIGTASAQELGRIEAGMLRPDELFRLVWKDGCEIFAPRPFKAYNLRAPELTAEARALGEGRWRIELAAEKAPAFYAALETDRPGRFSDNAVTVLPGLGAEIVFQAAEASGPPPKFTLRDLHSATYGR